ncbi:DUF5808 domain-containing protein [Sporolactobacillus pectinivorans]|uniref:DUF5808 domain-containing protein n=1 Tax=Sporolactobacillus pectinivorans TaxID=1591408 RepID=UPI001EFCEEDE|nr:DUF5808 domain-containing protein [Sporolactobacillus pectinivorans]
MSTSAIAPLITYVMMAGLFIAQPWFSRRNIVFGVVFADDNIWRSDHAKKIRRRYIIETSVVAFILMASLILLNVNDKAVQTLAFNTSIIILIIAECLIFIAANRRTQAFKRTMRPDPSLTPNSIIIETKKSDRETLLPIRWLLLLVLLFVATVAVAYFGYPYMPASIPTHFGLSGPDQWGRKSWQVVLSPALLQAVLIFVIFFIRRAPASVRGNPNAAPDYERFRKLMGVLMITFGLITELIFLMTDISLIIPVPSVWFLAASIAGIIMEIITVLTMIFLYMHLARAKHVAGPILDDDARWIWGMLYFNPSDPSIFVEKRVGIGYTINMARPSAWIVMIGIIVIIIVLSTHQR